MANGRKTDNNKDEDNVRLSPLSIARHVRSLFSLRTRKERAGTPMITLEELEAIRVDKIRQTVLLNELLTKLEATCSGGQEIGDDDSDHFVHAPLGEDGAVVTLDHSFVTQCLRVRNFDVEDADELVRDFVSFRLQQDWPLRVNALSECEDVQHAIKSDLHTVLHPRDIHGRKLLTVTYANLDSKYGNTKTVHKMGAYVLQKLTQDDIVTQDKGISVVLDFRNSSLKLLGQFSISDLKRGIAIMRYSPVKIKHVYIVGARFLVRVAINVILRAVSKTMRSKVQFIDGNGDFKTLHRDLHNPEMLPNSLGGQVDDITFSREWRQRLAGTSESVELASEESVSIEQGGDELSKTSKAKGSKTKGRKASKRARKASEKVKQRRPVDVEVMG